MTLTVYQLMPSPHNDGRNGWHAIIGYDLKGKPDYIGGYGWGKDAIEALAKAYGDAAHTLSVRRPRVDRKREENLWTLSGTAAER